MGLCDFFLATDEEIATAFRGWKRAAPLLEEFVVKTVTNPFTGEPRTIRTLVREEQPEPDADAVENGDFRKLPRIDQKGISSVDVVSLASVLMGWGWERADSEIHGRLFRGPTEAEVVLCEMPPGLVSRLGQLGSDERKKHGKEWSARRREDARSIPNEFIRKTQMARPDSSWISRLGEISKLAKRAAKEARSMFLWISP